MDVEQVRQFVESKFPELKSDSRKEMVKYMAILFFIIVLYVVHTVPVSVALHSRVRLAMFCLSGSLRIG